MLSAAVNQNKFAIAGFNSVLVRYISLDINKKLFYMKVEVFWCCSLKIVWVLRLMALPQHDNVEEAISCGEEKKYAWILESYLLRPNAEIWLYRIWLNFKEK